MTRTLNWLVAVLFLGAGCGYTAPYRTSGASLSKDGVGIEMVGESCVANSGGDVVVPSVDDYLLNLDVKLQVENHSSQQIIVLPDHIRLVGTENGVRTEVRPVAQAARTLLPGQSEQLSLAYRHRGSLACRAPLELDATGGVARAGRPVTFAPIDFVASR